MPRLRDKTVIVTGGARGIGRAIVAKCADEGAATGVARPDRAFHGRWNMPTVRSSGAAGAVAAFGSGDLVLLEPLDEQGHCALDYGSRITIRHGAAQQLRRAREQVVAFPAQGHS